MEKSLAKKKKELDIRNQELKENPLNDLPGRRLPRLSTGSGSLKRPSIGSEKAPITRDDSGGVIGSAGIIGIGGEKWRKGVR